MVNNDILPRQNLFWLFVSALILLMMLGCRQSQQTGTAVLTIELIAPLNPSLANDREMSLRVTDEAGQPVNDAALDIKGDMTHAGMVPVLANAQNGVGGVYTAPFVWTMTGDWIVTVRATLPDGRWDEAEFRLRVGQ